MPHPVIHPKVKSQNSKIVRLVPSLITWFSRNARDLPWRRTRDPYAIWVSEIMLQQTQVKTVTPYWNRWMTELPTVTALAAAPPDKIHKLWEGLGYYTRVRNLQKAAQQIVEQHHSAFPSSFDEVLALPGIGRYTAGAICSIAFGQPTAILDGNVIRVLTRIFGIAGNPREKDINSRLWNLAQDLVNHAAIPSTDAPLHRPATSHLNQALMELGAMVCTPRAPKCEACPAAKFCVAFRQNRVAELPNLEKRPAATARSFRAFVIEREGRFLVRQRPAGVVNAHLWEFPNVELLGKIGVNASAQAALGFAPRNLELLCAVKHSITRYRITLEAFRAYPRRHSDFPSAGHWLTHRELHPLAFTSAHKKILAFLSEPKRVD